MDDIYRQCCQAVNAVNAIDQIHCESARLDQMTRLALSFRMSYTKSIRNQHTMKVVEL
jgi:hypothetical protein